MKIYEYDTDELKGLISDFIVRESISGFKARYVLSAKERDAVIDKVLEMVNTLCRYDGNCCLNSEHKIVFVPDSRAYLRLNEVDAEIENCLHFLTQKRSSDYDEREFSGSKFRKFDFIYETLKSPDHIVSEGEKLYYIKNLKQEKKAFFEVVLYPMPKKEEMIYRVTGFMPDKKRLRGK